MLGSSKYTFGAMEMSALPFLWFPSKGNPSLDSLQREPKRMVERTFPWLPHLLVSECEKAKHKATLRQTTYFFWFRTGAFSFVWGKSGLLEKAANECVFLDMPRLCVSKHIEMHRTMNSFKISSLFMVASLNGLDCMTYARCAREPNTKNVTCNHAVMYTLFYASGSEMYTNITPIIHLLNST